MIFEDYRHAIPLQIRFSDVDRVNHINNAVYHTYIELGRVHYFNQVLKREVDWDVQGFVLARTEMDYIKPIYLRDEIFCFTKTIKLGNKSVLQKSCIARLKENSYLPCALAITTLVAMDYRTQKSIEVPEGWRQLFREFEGLSG